MAFNKAQTKVSLGKWQERETRFRKNWRSKSKADPRRAYWYQRLVQAKRMVRQRTVELSKFAAPILDPEVTVWSPNRSSRGGVKPRLIVLHITVSHNRKGVSDVKGICDYFARPATRASSHIVNDGEGNDGRCVPDEYKAWTQVNANSYSLSVEQIQPINLSIAAWKRDYPKQLENTAQWVAYWSTKYGIPLIHSTRTGVCGHAELGPMGGGHSDCPAALYPFDFVIARARALQSNH